MERPAETLSQCLWERRDNLTREEKAKVIEGLRTEFQRAKAVVFTEYQGLTVAEMNDLRAELGEGLVYRVVKNTLAKKASEGTGISSAASGFKGPIGIAIGFDDPVLTVKKVAGYSKRNDKLKVRSGVVEGKVFGPSDLTRIAGLPPREVLLSQLLGGMTAPLSKMAGALQATVTQFAFAVQALKQKKEAAG